VTPRTFTVLSAVLSCIVTACGSTSRVTKPLQGTPPATIAVLPLQGGNLTRRGREIVRRVLGSALQYRRYTILDDEFVDEQLALAGHQPWLTDWLPPDAELARFGHGLGVDAILVSEGFQDSSIDAGVFYRRGLEGHLRLLDVASAETFWSVDAGTSASGGALIGSGQIVKALIETAEAGSEATFVRHASGIALDVMDLIPESAEREPRQRPQVSAVSLRTTGRDATLRPDDRIEVEAHATPRGRATATVGGRLVDYPLVEVADGVYRGSIRIEPGTGDGTGPATVAVVDAFGNASESRQSEASVAFIAPRVEPPAGLAATVVDRDHRRVRLSWQAVAGAKEYLVFRSVPSGASRTLAPVAATEVFDLVPEAETSAVYFVQARLGPGVSSAKSVPVTIAF